jgi:HEAT repeat protein
VAALRGWRTWWGLNQRRFLVVRRRRAAATGGEDGAAGDSATLQWLLERLEDDYFDVRSAAAIALGRAGNAGTAGFIQGRLTDPNPDVRESALLGLGLLESPIAVMPLQMVVREERIRPRPRAMATVALGLSGSSVAVPALRHAARSAERLEIRGAALLSLGLTGGAMELPLLAAAAEDATAEPEARALAVNGHARLARRLDDPAGTKAVLDHLRRLTATAVAPAVRQSAVQAFGLLADFRALPTLLALLADEDAMVSRLAAVTAAEMARGKSEQSQVYDALAPLLERGRAKSESRAFTALALGLLGDRRAGAALLTMLEKESNHDTRAAAAVALGLLPYTPAAQRLTEIAAAKGNPALRAYAVLALGMLRDAAGTATLHELLLNAKAPELRAAAAVALGLTGGARSPKALAALLADSNVFVRISIVHALGHLRDDGGLAPLMDRFKREPNDEVRTMIVVAVGRIVQRGDLAPHHSLARGLNYLHPGLGARLVIGLE